MRTLALVLCLLFASVFAQAQEDPKPIASVEEGIQLVRSFEGKPEDFVLVVPESLMDSVGLNIAIITNEILMRGWWPTTVTRKPGYRVFRYKKREKSDFAK
jgi:hypothetical protein